LVRVDKDWSPRCDLRYQGRYVVSKHNMRAQFYENVFRTSFRVSLVLDHFLLQMLGTHSDCTRGPMECSVVGYEEALTSQAAA
jgi:hypothetical protein